MSFLRWSGLVALTLTSALAVAGNDAERNRFHRDADGFLVTDVHSPYQSAPVAVRALLPDGVSIDAPAKRYPVVYVLPVERGTEDRYGDGLREVRANDLHNQHAAIFVAPSFAQLPWYADHPDKPDVQQERHFVEVVVPLVEETLPARSEKDARLLLGFSKSGWGAWSLLLRHPDTFGKAASWDAPLMMKQLGRYGTTPIFGKQENFRRYRLSDLLADQADKLQGEQRLILTGYGNFQDHLQKTHALLNDLQIPHHYREQPQRSHDWHSGWVAEAVDLLMK